MAHWNKQTLELCGKLYDARNARSPRCTVAKEGHADHRHRAMTLEGETVEWNTAERPIPEQPLGQA